MSEPISPSQVRTYQTVRPPPTEMVALGYFTPLLAPTPVATRVPQPSNTADTINGFLRLEAAGGVLRADGIFWDVSCILHAYANNTDESLAEQLGEEAVAWGANMTGTSVVMPNGDKWYCTWARCSGWNTRKADPLVAMVRYRSMVTWRMPGLPIVPGQRFRRRVTSEEVRAQDAVAGTDGPVVVNRGQAQAPRPGRRKR